MPKWTEEQTAAIYAVDQFESFSNPYTKEATFGVEKNQTRSGEKVRFWRFGVLGGNFWCFFFGKTGSFFLVGLGGFIVVNTLLPSQRSNRMRANFHPFLLWGISPEFLDCIPWIWPPPCNSEE